MCSDAGDSLNDCRIMFLTEIYKIEEPGSLSDAPPGTESPLKSKSLQGDDQLVKRLLIVDSIHIKMKCMSCFMLHETWATCAKIQTKFLLYLSLCG